MLCSSKGNILNIKVAVNHLLEICVPDIMVDQQHPGYDAEHFVKQVDFGECVGHLARVLDKEGDETDVRIQGVEALGADQSGGVVLRGK